METTLTKLAFSQRILPLTPMVRLSSAWIAAFNSRQDPDGSCYSSLFREQDAAAHPAIDLGRLCRRSLICVMWETVSLAQAITQPLVQKTVHPPFAGKLGAAAK